MTRPTPQQVEAAGRDLADAIQDAVVTYAQAAATGPGLQARLLEQARRVAPELLTPSSFGGGPVGHA